MKVRARIFSEPAFWRRSSSWIARVLWPVAAIYGEIAAMRMRKEGIAVGVPVICVGNYHVGGAGKTPTTLALVALLRDLGETPVVLSRGYGGRLKGPVSVDPIRHTARDVGDEPLMMAESVPVVIARDRVNGSALARSRGASVIVMDDGFQNPSVMKDASIIVIDGHSGLGNSFVFPAGPVRAPLNEQIARSDALVVIGDGHAADGVVAAIIARGAPVFRAHLTPDAESVAGSKDQRVLAFAGIGDPERFFRTLRAAGIAVVATRAFGDHQPYTKPQIDALHAQARAQGLTLVTTQKDIARLGAHADGIVAFKVTLAFDEDAAFRAFVIDRLEQARMKAFRGR